MTNDEFLFEQVSIALSPILQGGPLPNILAAKAVAFLEATTPEFKEWAKSTVSAAKALSSRFMQRGLSVISGGTDNHSVLVDLRPLHLTESDAELALNSCYIVANRDISYDVDEFPGCSNTVLRIDTCSAVTRGISEAQFTTLANLIVAILFEMSWYGFVTSALKDITRKFVFRLASICPILYPASCAMLGMCR